MTMPEKIHTSLMSTQTCYLFVKASATFDYNEDYNA